MLFVKYSEDKIKLGALVESDQKFRSLDRDTARVISAVTGSKIKIDEREENVDMCKAIQDMRLESLEQGIEQERQRMILVMASLLRDTGLSENDIIDRITVSTGLTVDDVSRYLYGGND